jgi:hypothetical protein
MSQLTGLDPVLVTPLRRPERRPRKRPSAAVKARPIVIKTAFSIVVGAVAFAFAGRVAAFAVEPVLVTHRTGAEITRLKELKAKEAHINAQLKQDIEYLATAAGVEQEARRRGWVKPGEVALAFKTADQPAEAPKDEVAAEPVRTALAETSPSVSDRIRAAVDTCLSVFGSGSRPR